MKVVEKKYTEALDAILEVLILEYEHIHEGVNFYSGTAPQSIRDKISQKITQQYHLKEWEVGILLHHLLIDKYIISIDPLSISFDGLVFRGKGGYAEKARLEIVEQERINNMENEIRISSKGLMIFTGLVAIGTLISGIYFAIEIWRFFMGK